MEKDENNLPPDNKEDRYVDKTTQDRIHQHLADPDSKITEDDIAKVDTDIFSRPLTEEEKKADEEELKEKFPPKAGSAWDVNS